MLFLQEILPELVETSPYLFSPFLSCIHTLSSMTIKAIHPGLREESLIS